MINVIVFEGGEYVSRDNAVQIGEWSVDAIRQLIAARYDDWINQPVEFTDPTDPVQTCGESVALVSDNLAQAVLCGTEGGMIYVSRC